VAKVRTQQHSWQLHKTCGAPAVAAQTLLPPAPVIAATARRVGAICCQQPACLRLLAICCSCCCWLLLGCWLWLCWPCLFLLQHSCVDNWRVHKSGWPSLFQGPAHRQDWGPNRAIEIVAGRHSSRQRKDKCCLTGTMWNGQQDHRASVK
jgi:hypothetical protein